MEDDDIVRLVCGLAGDPITRMTPGTTRGHYCTICADEIVMSPRMAAFAEANPKAQPICARCAASVVDEDHKVAPLPGDTGRGVTHKIMSGIRRYYGGEKRGHFN